METTWILAADGNRARIFEVLGFDQPLREIEDLANPAARAHDRAIRAAEHGRLYAKAERHAEPAADPETGPVDHEIELFSKEVSRFLDQARLERRYDKLRVFASPNFMGMIRQNLSKEVQHLVEEENAKEISWLGANDIEGYIKHGMH